MPTTYELYTNENGTPKAVEGKAPAIVERVESLETSVESLETSVETAQATAEACLPLAGGTLKGGIKGSGEFIANSRGDEAGYVRINGGSGFETGASLLLSGNNMPDYTGKFLIEASDHNNRTILEGRPNGMLTWGNKEVERVNSSGNKWIRYENGLQICWGFQSISSSTKITYAVPFTDNIIVQVGGTYVGPSYYYTAIPASTKTTCSFTVVKISSGVVELPPNDAPSFSWLAIGRWK